MNDVRKNLVLGVTHQFAASQTQTFGVSEFDEMNRRKQITREDGTRWAYGYNAKGEVTSALREKTASPNTPVPGWNHGYTFDEIGNRLSSGDQWSPNSTTYTPNSLNQYEARTVPRSFKVIGKANAAGSGAVHGPTMTARSLSGF
jgi:YD repeat-containing protein